MQWTDLSDVFLWPGEMGSRVRLRPFRLFVHVSIVAGYRGESSSRVSVSVGAVRRGTYIMGQRPLYRSGVLAHVESRGIGRSSILKVVLALGVVLGHGCGYRYYTGPLQPVPEARQAVQMRVSDDGTLTFVQDRLEVSVRPLTDEELNRQLFSVSQADEESANPYTFGDWKDPETGSTPTRFTVFSLKVKNYTYPKVWVDPAKASLVASNGRIYKPLSLLELKEYYRIYATAYAGAGYSLYEERRDILTQTFYPGTMVFSGQEQVGFVVFPKLHHDVERIRLDLADVVLRFNFRDEPVETVDIGYFFEREIGRVYLARGESLATKGGEGWYLE